MELLKNTGKDVKNCKFGPPKGDFQGLDIPFPPKKENLLPMAEGLILVAGVGFEPTTFRL